MYTCLTTTIVITGDITDFYGSYVPPFLISGCTSMVGGLLFIIVYVVSHTLCMNSTDLAETNTDDTNGSVVLETIKHIK